MASRAPTLKPRFFPQHHYLLVFATGVYFQEYAETGGIGKSPRVGRGRVPSAGVAQAPQARGLEGGVCDPAPGHSEDRLSDRNVRRRRLHEIGGEGADVSALADLERAALRLLESGIRSAGR